MTTTKRCEHCGQNFVPKWANLKLCYSCWQLRESMFEQYPLLERRLTELMQRQQQTAIPAAMLKRLLHLAHPDKHNGSAAATEATRWLLEQRKKASR